METERNSTTEDNRNASERLTGVEAGEGRIYGSKDINVGDDRTGSPKDVSKESDKDEDTSRASEIWREAGD
jgi:hypothetical protein